MSSQNKLLMLGVLVVGLVVSLWVGQRERVPTELRAGAKTHARAAKSAAPFEAADVPVVQANPPGALPGEQFPRNRSLFAYSQSPEEVARIEQERKEALRLAEAQKALDQEAAEKRAKEQRERDEIAAKQRADDARNKAKEAALHPPKPVPPKFSYEYVGIVGPRDAAYAILVGPDQKFTYARAGDVIDSQFRIESVDRVKLDVSYTDPKFEGEFTQVPRSAGSASSGTAPPSKSAPPKGRSR